MIAARLRALLSQQHGVTAVETALILPVLLFRGDDAVRTGAHLADDRHRQPGPGARPARLSRRQGVLPANPEALQDAIEERLVDYSYGLLNKDNFVVEIFTFDTLRQFGGAEADKEIDDQDQSPPVLSVTVDLTQPFMTPLPMLFGIGDAFQYQYRQLLGNLTSDKAEDY